MERRQQRLVIIVFAVVVLAILAIPAYGYYNSFIAPPRVWAAQVRETTFTMGDLVKRIRVRQGLTGSVDMRVLPFEYLFSMMEDELIRQAAPRYDITVNEADVEQVVRDSFYPDSPEGEEISPDQLDQEFEESYKDYLTRTRLSDSDHRSRVEADLYRDRLREELGKRVPTEAEQVEVHWIKLPTDPDSDLVGIRKRLEEGEDFAQVAQEVSTERRFADENGYVGWVPQNAFPRLDETLFGDEDMEPIPHNQLSDIVSSGRSLYILKVVGGPEVREISDIMLEQMKSAAFQIWIDEERQTGSKDGWLKLNFNSDLYAWVTKQVRGSAPRTPPDQGSR